MASPEVSLVLPALNEWGNLREVVPALLKLPLHQLILIDDASSDGTESAWRNSAFASDPRLVYIRNNARLGLACSVLQGIHCCTGTHVIIRDSDRNHDVDDTAALLSAGIAGADFCVASRYKKAPRYGRVNDAFSHFLSRLLAWKFGAISDWTNGFFLLRLSELNAMPASWIFRGRGEYTLRLFRLLLARGLKPSEIPTLTRARGEGKSTTRIFRHGLSYIFAALERTPPDGIVEKT